MADMQKQWERDGILVKRTHKVAGGEEVTYYVPKGYDYWGDSGKERREEAKGDNCCFPPMVEFDKKSGKWILHFSGADNGGYDVRPFTYYFDNLDDILEFMCFPVSCSCIK